MIFYINAELNKNTKIGINCITAKTRDGREVEIDYDEAMWNTENCKFSARLKGIYIDETYANGKLDFFVAQVENLKVQFFVETEEEPEIPELSYISVDIQDYNEVQEIGQGCFLSSDLTPAMLSTQII